MDDVNDVEGGADDADVLVGANVRRYRTAKGLSQADLAAALSVGGEHVHQQTILKIEKGTRPLRFSEAVRISEALGISPVSLSEEVGGAKENAEFVRQANRLSAMMVVLNGFAAELATLLADYADWLDLQENSGARPDRIAVGRQLLATDWGACLNHELRVRLKRPVDDAEA